MHPGKCEVFWTLRDCCSHLCKERLQPADNFEEKELQSKMKEWGRALKWAGLCLKTPGVLVLVVCCSAIGEASRPRR